MAAQEDKKNTRTGKPEKFSAEEVALALVKCKGIVAEAARSLGCARGTVYVYMNKYPAVKAAYDEACAVMLDEAESKLYELAITNGEFPALRYLLNCKGRKRGYGERLEHTGPEGKAIKVEFDVGKLAHKHFGSGADGG